MQTDAKGSPQNKSDRHHANGLWARFESYREGYGQGAKYALPTPISFDDWDISQRYAHQENFAEERVVRHQEGARAVRTLLKEAQLDGLI
nr:hypothetical protein [Pararhodospirillum photometricum]